MKENYKALGMQAKNIHAQVAFSSILSARGMKEARSRYIVHINFWLHGWCQHESFDFYTNRIFYEDYNLLWRDGIHLSKRGWATSGSKLTNLVK